MRTDKIIPNNKPGTIIRDKKKGTCMLIDAAIPGDKYAIKKEDEKILKYKDLMMKFSAWGMCKQKGYQ